MDHQRINEERMGLLVRTHTGRYRSIQIQRASDPIQSQANPGMLYALLAIRPESWWWADGQSTELLSQRKNHEMECIQLYLCRSGRICVQWSGEGNTSYLCASAIDQPDAKQSFEVSYVGGNGVDILPKATVCWETAWEAVAELFITGEKKIDLNWISESELIRTFGVDDVISPR